MEKRSEKIFTEEKKWVRVSAVAPAETRAIESPEVMNFFNQ